MENQNIQQNQNQQSPKSPQFKLPKIDYGKFDEKTIATIKAGAIWNAVASLIMSFAGMIASYYFLQGLYGNPMGRYGRYIGGYAAQVYTPQLINVGALISAIIYGAIGGAIGGWIIAKFYPVFVGWQKKYVQNKLNSFFKILFWPYLVGFVISIVLTGALSAMYSGFSAFIIVAIADLLAVYIYAKMMDKDVGKYYK